MYFSNSKSKSYTHNYLVQYPRVLVNLNNIVLKYLHPSQDAWLTEQPMSRDFGGPHTALSVAYCFPFFMQASMYQGRLDHIRCDKIIGKLMG
jgi:hypothetical protein